MKHNLCFKCGENTLTPKIAHDKDGYVSIRGYSCKCGAHAETKYGPDKYRCVSCGKVIPWANKKGDFDCSNCRMTYHSE